MNPFEIPKPQDIHQSDQEVRIAFYTAAENEDYNGMIDAIYNSDGTEKSALSGKCVNKDFYNKFIQYFLQAEDYNQSGVLDRLSNYLAQYNKSIQNISGVGEYSSTKQYEINNIVIYNKKSYFVKTKPPVGTLPTDANYFISLNLEGEKGNTSLGMNGYGVWDSTYQYPQYYCVEYNDCLWISKSDNINQTPSDNSDYWSLIIEYNKAVPYLSDVSPDYNTNGGIWLESVSFSGVYTIRYDANQGSNAPTDQYKKHGIAITLTEEQPVRDGYVFLGWSISDSATEATYLPGNKFTMDSNIILYAVWAKAYTLTVNPGGLTYSGVYNTTKEITAPTQSYTVTYDYNDGSESHPTATSNIPFSSWSLSGGGSINSTTANPTTYTYGTSDGALTASYGTAESIILRSASRDGLVAFGGWYTEPDGGERVGGGADSYTPTKDITLYAHWIPIYTITYNPNGGSGEPNSQLKTHGVALTLSSTIPTRGGYNFLGWATTDTAISAEYSAGATFTTDADTTLYAVWEEVTIYNVPIGSYILYQPSSTSSTVLASDSGYTSNQTYNPSSITSWKVFKNNNGQLDIISSESVGDLTLSGETGYAKAVYTLNNMCSNYVNTTYATNGRSLGCVLGSSMEIIDTDTYPLTWGYTYAQGNKGFPYTDTYYEEDMSIINTSINGSYPLRHTGDMEIWLASRDLYAYASHANFQIRKLSNNNSPDKKNLYIHASPSASGGTMPYSNSCGVRPIISLKSALSIISGTGTEEDPYVVMPPSRNLTIKYNCPGSISYLPKVYVDSVEKLALTESDKEYTIQVPVDSTVVISSASNVSTNFTTAINSNTKDTYPYWSPSSIVWSKIMGVTTYDYQFTMPDEDVYIYGYVTSPSCFVAGTRVLMTNNDYKNIEDVQIGDSVYCYDDENKEISSAVVENILTSKQDSLINIRLDNDDSFICTSMHPIYSETYARYVNAGELKAGDVLKTNNGYVRIYSVETLEKENTVYNLTVSNHHNYFVTSSNILVHNKS